MSNRAVEVASVPVRPHVDLTASSSEAGIAWTSAMITVAKQPGVISLYWGSQIEHPDTIQMIVEWDDVSSQAAFTAGPEYLPFVNSLKDILAGAPSLFNILLSAPSTSDANPFSQPVTEIMKVHFSPPSTPSDVGQNTHFSQFRAVASKIPNLAARGIVGGWDLAPTDRGLDENAKGQLFAAFIGWPSVEAHGASVKSEDFGKALENLRAASSALESVHVAFKKVK